MYDLNSNNPNPVINYDGVSKNITSVGFHEDGRWMYTGGEDCMARIWDLRWAGAAALPPVWGQVGAPGSSGTSTLFPCRSRNLQCQRIFQVNAPINCVCLHPNQVSVIPAASQLVLPALPLGKPGGCGVLCWQLQHGVFSGGTHARHWLRGSGRWEQALSKVMQGWSLAHSHTWMGSEPYSSVSPSPSPPLCLEEAVGTPMLGPWGCWWHCGTSSDSFVPQKLGSVQGQPRGAGRACPCRCLAQGSKHPPRGAGGERTSRARTPFVWHLLQAEWCVGASAEPCANCWLVP